MSSALREEISFGLESLDKVYDSIGVIAAHDISEAVREPALAFECLGYYNAIEHLIIRFLKFRGLPRPAGASSHRDALNAFVKLCDELDYALQPDLLAVITELMGFRHVATKIYGSLLDHER